MAEQQEQIIFDVKIDIPEVADKLSAISSKIQDLKDKRDALNRIVKEGGELTRQEARDLAQVEKDLKANIAAQKALTGQLQITQKTNAELGTSFREMDAQLRQLENQYKSLTKEQRATEEGMRLRDAIIQQKQALKEFDEELGNHQRNVGNYPSALKGVFPVFDQMNAVLSKVGISLDSLQTNGVKAFSGLGASVKSFGKMFLTPPVAIIAAVLGAIVYAVKQLREAFARNDDASTKLQAAFARLQPIGDAIGKLFNKLADYVATLVDKFADMYEWVIRLGNKLGIVSDEFLAATEAAAALVHSIDDLQEAERNYAVNSARRNRDIAKYRVLAQEADNPEKRRDYLKRAIDLERENLEERQKIAQKALNNLLAEQKKAGDTSDETKDKIAAARAALFDAETAYFEGTRRLMKQLSDAEEDYNKTLAQMEEDARRCEELINTLLAPITEDLPKMTEDGLKALRENLPEITDEIEEEVIPVLSQWQQKVADLMKQGYAFADAQKIVAMEVKQSYADAAGAIGYSFSESFRAVSQLITAFGEESEEAAKASKTFAILSIIASEAESIANGVVAVTAAIAGATKAGAATGIAAPITTPAFIAEMVGIVGGVLATTMANIVQAKKVLDGGKFATGGVVGGTSYSGDNVIARVNSREMIITPEQQAELLDVANGRSGANFEMVRAAMVAAFREMPAPILEYKEFKQFEKNVITYKEIAAI